MVQWESIAVLARLEIINMNLIYLLLGLYGWEYFQSIDVEYAAIRGRLTIRWRLIPYLVGRLCQFAFLLLVAIRINPPSKAFSCLAGAIPIALTADISLGCASTNLMIRTWVIWKDSRLVHVMLLVFALGHWIILALDVANLAEYQLGRNCGIHIKHPTVNAAVFVYSLCYDFLVLILSVVGLSWERPKSPKKSPLRKQLHAQGLSYFVVAVIFYIPPTVFSFLGVTLMVSMTGLTALTASTIASCRAVRSLLGLHSSYSSRSSTENSTEDDVALTSQIRVQSTMPPSGA